MMDVLRKNHYHLGTVLQDVQGKLQNQYRTLSIPKIAVRDDKASTIAEVDELYTELQLRQATEKFIKKDLTTRDGKIRVGKYDYKLLESWTDLLNPEKIKNLMIILWGGAGFGKTTLFKIIAHTWATSNQLAQFKLLFRIELKKMKTSSIIDAILDQCFLQDKRPAREDLIRIITKNESESVFLLDGLDELQPKFLEPSTDVYCVHNMLHKEALQQSRVLVATRPHKVADVIKYNPRSVCVETSGFAEKSTEGYISDYFRDNEGEGRRLIEIMKTKPILRQLGHIPVICQIVCYTFKFGESQLPDLSAQLYRKFTEVLAQRKCVGEDWKQRLEKALTDLGDVALDGLLDNSELVLTQSEFDECAFVLDDASGESGFIQQETYEIENGAMVIVTFLHKTFQEYSAAFYLANLYHANEKEFHKKLKQVNPDNVIEMGYVLRFACGILKGSPATGLILEHVQKQSKGTSDYQVQKVQGLARHLLFESRSDKVADKLDRPTGTDCESQEDLLAMRYYLQCLRKPLVELTDFTVHCRSHDDLTLLRDIIDLLPDNTAISPVFQITCRSQEDLNLLREILLSSYIRQGTHRMGPMKPFSVTYIMSEQATEVMQTIEQIIEPMDGGLRCQLRFTLEINEMSPFDGKRLFGCHTYHLIEEVKLRNRTYDDVSRLNKLGKCSCGITLKYIDVSDTNLHGHLGVVAPLVSSSLQSLKLCSCGLNDYDIPDLISILPDGHGLWHFYVNDNAFSEVGVETLTVHLKKLPKLSLISLTNRGPDTNHIRQMVRRNLPKAMVF